MLGDAWGKVSSGATWKKDQKEFGGLLGWARVVEVTDGANGWHVHVHALLCFTDCVSADLVKAGVGARMFNRWCSELRRQGFDASDEHGWDLRKVQLGAGDLADYFTKVAHEVTGGHRKEGRRTSGRAPMQLLADAVETYEVGNLARWWEWEAASEGRRQLTWSTGERDLRGFSGLARESHDDEVARADLDSPGVLLLPVASWVELGSRSADALSLLENQGLQALCSMLNALGLPFEVEHLEGTIPLRAVGRPARWACRVSAI